MCRWNNLSTLKPFWFVLNVTLAGERINEKDRCKKCNGVKVNKESKILEVHVDKGMKEGQKITFRGEGDQQVSTCSSYKHHIYKHVSKIHFYDITFQLLCLFLLFIFMQTLFHRVLIHNHELNFLDEGRQAFLCNMLLKGLNPDSVVCPLVCCTYNSTG